MALCPIQKEHDMFMFDQFLLACRPSGCSKRTNTTYSTLGGGEVTKHRLLTTTALVVQKGVESRD